MIADLRCTLTLGPDAAEGRVLELVTRDRDTGIILDGNGGVSLGAAGVLEASLALQRGFPDEMTVVRVLWKSPLGWDGVPANFRYVEVHAPNFIALEDGCGEGCTLVQGSGPGQPNALRMRFEGTEALEQAGLLYAMVLSASAQ